MVTIILILFLILGLSSVIIAYLLEGGALAGLISLSAFLTVYGGTISAVGVSFPRTISRWPKLFMVAIRKDENKMVEYLLFLREISVKARRDGLLSLEQEINSNTTLDLFIKKGITLAIDGLDSEALRSAMTLQLDSLKKRHKSNIELFEAAGGYSPTMGIIGTVMGLIFVLSNLEKPDELGEKIAMAFIATLYGVATANLLWLPLANALKQKHMSEVREKLMIIDGITQIQDGYNPMFLFEKLKGHLSPDELEAMEKKLLTNQ